MDRKALEVATEQLALSPPPMFDLPLPRELRDIIYGLLLSPRRVKAAPYHDRKHRPQLARNRSVAHTYRFHTNVLCINKTISAEAYEELFRADRFIVVSYQWPGLEEAIHTYDVPILTEHQKAVSNFRHHSARVHLRHRDISPKKPTCKTGSFLMLLRDIPALCRTVRWISLTAPALGNLVLKQPDTADDEFEHYWDRTVKKTFSTKIQFRSAPHVPWTYLVEACLSQALQHLRIPGQKVIVSGNTNTRTPDFLHKTAGAPIIFVTALAWDMIEMAKSMMSTARDLITTGDFDRAADRYWAIIGPTQEGLIFSTPDTIFTSDAEVPTVLLSRIMIEAAAAYGFLKLKALDVEAAKGGDQHAHGLCAFASNFDARDQILGFERRPRAYWYMMSPGWHLQILLQLEDGEELGRVMQQFEMLHEARPKSEHIAHDYDLVQSLLRGDTEWPRESSILTLTSACALPVQHFDFGISGYDRPRMDGWIMEDQMKGLEKMQTRQAKGL